MGGRGRVGAGGRLEAARGWDDHSAKRRKPSLLEPKNGLSAHGFAALGGEAFDWRQTNFCGVLRD